MATTFAADSTAWLAGRVLDSQTSQPLRGVTVVIESTQSGTISDSTGYFLLDNLPPGTFVLSVSHLGYAPTRRTVELKSEHSPDINIGLQPIATEIDGVSVTASRTSQRIFKTPQSVSVASGEEAHQRSFSTTAELLREEPGLLVQKTTHGHGSPIVRGLIGKYVLLLFDGIRLNRPTFRFGANQYLNTIDQQMLDRMEVVRGPASVAYGSDAIGGAINLIPKRPRPQPDSKEFEQQLITRYSSADNGFSLSTGHTRNCAVLPVYLGLTYKKIGDLRGGGSIGLQKPTGFDEISASSSISYYWNRATRISLDLIRSRQDEVPRYDKYASGDFSTYVYDPQNRDLAVLSYSWLSNSGRFESVRAGLSYGREEEGRTEQRTGSPILEMSSDRLTTWGGYVQTTLRPHQNGRLTFGGDFYRDRIASRRTAYEAADSTEVRPTYPNQSRYTSLGIFAEEIWAIDARTDLQFGIRYSNFKVLTELEPPFGLLEETYHDLSGALSVSRLLQPHLILIARWSQGFRAPNLNDVAVLKSSSSGVDVPSPGLTPESSNQLELGLKWEGGTFQGSLFAYYNRMTDLIDRRPGTYQGLDWFDENQDGVQDSWEADVYQRYNVGKARIYGLEAANRWILGEQWLIEADGFWTRGSNITDSEPMSRIPPIMGRVAVRYDVNPKKWIEVYLRAAGSQRRLSQRDIDDSRIDPDGTPGWITLNLRGGFRLTSHLKANLSLINLNHRAYKEHGSGVYSPGRGFELTIQYSN